MIHLTWEWLPFYGLVVVGFITGYLIWPFVWPRRAFGTDRFPVAAATIVATATSLNFVVFLAALRYVGGATVELQASLLLLSFVCACAVGLWFKNTGRA
jgi:hypothetical protein